MPRTVAEMGSEFGIASPEVMQMLRKMDVPVRGEASRLTDDQVARLRARWEREQRARTRSTMTEAEIRSDGRFISRDILRRALADLHQNYSPLLMVSVPCMTAANVPTCRSSKEANQKAVRFGASEEREWLEHFFKVSGGPRGKPYFMPSTGQFVQDRYADRSLQRRRKDFEANVFFHPDEARWAFRPEAATVLKNSVLGVSPKIPLVALMAWMWRDRPIRDLESAMAEFTRALGLDAHQDLLKSVYSAAIPREYGEMSLGDKPLTAEDIAELIGSAPPAPAVANVPEMVGVLEGVLAENHFVHTPGLVERIVGGWLVGDVVVLVGPTGSGKTFLSRVLGEGLERVFGSDRFFQAFLQVGPDYDVGQFLGYENLAGDFTAGRFAKEVLFVGRATDPRLVVLDEWNLAQIDSYFAPILSVIETGTTHQLPGRLNLASLPEDDASMLREAQPDIDDGKWQLPENTMFIATCNSWQEEPESRLPISGPVKRRCRIIPVPNVLLLRYKEKHVAGITEVCNELLAQERDAVQGRMDDDRRSVWDDHRLSRLAAHAKLEDLGEQFVNLFTRLVRLLLDDAHTSPGFTIGILKDVLLACVYAQNDQALKALGEQVADKVLHQVRGEPRILEVICELSRDLPNASEIDALARRMGAFSGERRVRPLV